MYNATEVLQLAMIHNTGSGKISKEECQLMFANKYVKIHICTLSYAVAQLVEALCYKMECRGFDSR
jgi:hypothetical protein